MFYNRDKLPPSLVRPMWRVRDSFFDRQGVLNQISKKSASVMRSFGALTRTIAKRSMKKRKDASEPGQPPRVIRGQLKKFIYFVYDRNSKSVVIGPIAWNSPIGIVPPILEYGGKITGKKNKRRTIRVVGDGGEVRIGGKRSVTTKLTRKTLKGNVDVTYAKLTTPLMAARANQIQEQLYGPLNIPSFEIEARPYMRPAFDVAEEKLPELWAGAVG
jgi:hypothetical protein